MDLALTFEITPQLAHRLSELGVSFAPGWYYSKGGQDFGPFDSLSLLKEDFYKQAVLAA